MPQIPFEQFLALFPVLPLPITLTEELAIEFSKENDVLPAAAIEQFILPMEPDADELTEFVPCFRIPKTEHFHALVYWKAGLLRYEFVLLTFTHKGVLIDYRSLAGTFAEGNTVTQSVATIDEDWVVTIVAGQAPAERGALYDASGSKTIILEVAPNGAIIEE